MREEIYKVQCLDIMQAVRDEHGPVINGLIDDAVNILFKGQRLALADKHRKRLAKFERDKSILEFNLGSFPRKRLALADACSYSTLASANDDSIALANRRYNASMEILNIKEISISEQLSSSQAKLERLLSSQQKESARLESHLLRFRKGDLQPSINYCYNTLIRRLVISEYAKVGIEPNPELYLINRPEHFQAEFEALLHDYPLGIRS